MDIILLSGLSQAGTAWLRVAVLKDAREFCEEQMGWAGGLIPSRLLRWLKTKLERSVLLQSCIYSPAIPSCTYLRAFNPRKYFIFRVLL